MMTTTATTRRTLKRPLLTIVWIATIAVFAGLLLHPAVPDAVRSLVSRPNRLLQQVVEYGAHVAVFFVGTQFALVCFEGTTRGRFLAILSLAVVTAIAAEAAQAWVPTRGVDVLDAVCNIIGAAFAALAYRKMFAMAPSTES
jgi:VanZ family protein